LSTIARTQIPSRLLEFCTIDPDYRTAKEATPRDFQELAPIDTAYLDFPEELQFNHWPEDLEPVLAGAGRPSGTVVESTVRTYYPPGV
jgi:hypothetical protein